MHSCGWKNAAYLLLTLTVGFGFVYGMLCYAITKRPGIIVNYYQQSVNILSTYCADKVGFDWPDVLFLFSVSMVTLK